MRLVSKEYFLWRRKVSSTKMRALAMRIPLFTGDLKGF
jgi:hypothetical protein